MGAVSGCEGGKRDGGVRHPKSIPFRAWAAPGGVLGSNPKKPVYISTPRTSPVTGEYPSPESISLNSLEGGRDFYEDLDLGLSR